MNNKLHTAQAELVALEERKTKASHELGHKIVELERHPPAEHERKTLVEAIEHLRKELAHLEDQLRTTQNQLAVAQQAPTLE